MYDETLDPMANLIRTSCGLLIGMLLLWGTVSPTATAQQTHTLTIRDGTIYVDGHALSNDQVPNDLDLEGITAQYQFMGIQTPVIELNGRLFAIEDSLQKVSRDEIAGQTSSVVLQEISARPSSARTTAASRDPQRQYLKDVQQANRKLYKRLVRERAMEQRAQGLARIIRMLPANSDKRQAKADTLRALLNRIFELKQENRRREIGRLERKIQELQRRLEKRQRMRTQMIEHRFQQLLGTTSDQ